MLPNLFNIHIPADQLDTFEITQIPLNNFLITYFIIKKNVEIKRFKDFQLNSTVLNSVQNLHNLYNLTPFRNHSIEKKT